MTEHSMCQPGRPGPIGRVPEASPGFGRLPQGEIAGAVFFIFVHIDARAIFHSRKIFLGKLAVAGKFCDAKVIGAIVGAIGEALFLQLRNELRHLLNMLGGANQYRLLDIQSGAVFEKGLFVFRGVLLYAHAFAARSCG